MSSSFGGNDFAGQWPIKALVEAGTEVLCCDLNESPVCAEIPYMQVDIRGIDQINKVPITDNDITINLAANHYHVKVPKGGAALWW